MKAVIMLISLLSTCFHAYGQKPQAYGKAAAGVGIGQIMRKRTVDLEIGYAISRHWSMEGASSLPLHIRPRPKSEEEKMHESLLGKTEITEDETSAQLYRGSVCYWPEEAFRKGFISVGFRYKEHEKPECIICVGYIIQIWKGLAISLSVEAGSRDLEIGTMKLHEHIDIGLKHIF